jgi:hypothetical protein
VIKAAVDGHQEGESAEKNAIIEQVRDKTPAKPMEQG